MTACPNLQPELSNGEAWKAKMSWDKLPSLPETPIYSCLQSKEKPWLYQDQQLVSSQLIFHFL